MLEVFAFSCRIVGSAYETIINTTTRGKAKAAFMLDIHDIWPNLRYTDIRARKIGPPHTSKAFKRNAAYRGLPDVCCGQRVQVGQNQGVIVGHNESANFNILFDPASKFGHIVLNVHPGDIAFSSQQNDKQTCNKAKSPSISI